MNSSTLLKHLLLKDLRHQRGWLALIWISALLLPWSARYLGDSGHGASDPLILLLTGGLLLLILLVLVRLIRLDAPGRELHFLATRPVPWTVLLTGKALFIAVLLLLPIWITQLGILWLMKIPVTSLDVVLLLVEKTISVGALLAAALVFSLFLRSLPVIFAFIIGTAVLILAAATFLRERSYHSGVMQGEVNFPLQGCQFLICHLGILLTVGVVAMLRYRRKSLLPPLIVLTAGLTLSLLAKNHWPYDLSQLVPDQPQAPAELPAALRDSIKLTLTGEEGKNGNSLGGGNWNGIHYLIYNHQVLLEGVEPPYFATVVDYHAEATLKSGRQIHSSYKDVDSHGGIGGMSGTLRQQMAGFTSTEPLNWRENTFEIFNYLTDPYRKEDLTGTRVQGVLTLEICRALILKTMPLRMGDTVDRPRRHYQLQKVDVTPASVDYKITTNSVTSALRGDYPGSGSWENIFWVIYNRSKGEFLDGGSYGSGNDKGFFYNTGYEEGSRQRQTINGGWKKAREPFPEDWAGQAEISVFSSEVCGRINLQYEVQKVDLKH